MDAELATTTRLIPLSRASSKVHRAVDIRSFTFIGFLTDRIGIIWIVFIRSLLGERQVR